MMNKNGKISYRNIRESIRRQRYQCQIKRFGIWWNDESFSTKERMLDYARKLEKAGHIAFNYL